MVFKTLIFIFFSYELLNRSVNKKLLINEIHTESKAKCSNNESITGTRCLNNSKEILKVENMCRSAKTGSNMGNIRNKR